MQALREQGPRLMQKPLLPVFVAIMLVLLASYYWRPGGNPDADPDMIKRQMALAQTYVENTRSWEYNEQGVLSEVLEASRMEYFKQRDASELEQPRFYSHDGNDRTWSASADRGLYRHSAGRLRLNHNVVLNNDQTNGKLESAAMTINVKNNTATSRVPVTITQNDSSMRADGMVADLNRERIVMTKNVESTYVPARP